MIIDIDPTMFSGLFKYESGGYFYVSDNVEYDSASSMVFGDLYIIDNIGVKKTECLSWQFFRDLMKNSKYIENIEEIDIPINIRAKLKLMGVIV